jgi:hypothetical protein
MFDIPKAVEAVSNALKGIFDFASTAKEHQSETQIIKENKKLKKASDIAEKIISLGYKYLDYFNEKDRKKFVKLHDDFKDNN